MSDNQSNVRYFNLAGVRRRITMSNTRETRENWFKGYKSDEENRLRSQIRTMPQISKTPDELRHESRPFPKKLVTILVMIAIAIVASWINKWLLWTCLIPIAYVIVPVVKKVELEAIGLFDLPMERRKVFRISLALILLVACLTTFLSRGWSVFASFVLMGLVSLGWIADVNKYLEEREEVRSHNASVQFQIRAYESSIAARQAVETSNRDVQSRIDQLAIECLDLSEMARLRRGLLDQALEAAFAELGVSTHDQQTVLADRDRHVLEITGPTAGIGTFASPYEQPIIEFPSGLPRFSRYDTPALVTYLSHLYVCRIGLVLPQGFGYFEALVDSVDLRVHPRGHELLLWKAISRVTRMNAGDEFEADSISIQTYGGSETVLPVNGMYIREQQERVQTIDSASNDDLGFENQPHESDYHVNSFVLSVQQRMSSVQ